MGAKPATVSGLSGLGDIMLTCYGALSRNRAVGIRLGQGEALQDILDSSSQVHQTPIACHLPMARSNHDDTEHELLAPECVYYDTI